MADDDDLVVYEVGGHDIHADGTSESWSAALDSGGQWVRRSPVVTPHRCVPPVRTVMVRLPDISISGVSSQVDLADDGFEREPVKLRDRPDGQPGDLWRCGCGLLWRVAPYQPSPPPSKIGGYMPGTPERWVRCGKLRTWWHRHHTTTTPEATP